MPTRQDGVENRDKVYSSRINVIQSKVKRDDVVEQQAVTKGWEVRANMYVYLKGAIDAENRFHKCVRELEKVPLVLLSTKGISAEHECGN